MNIKKVSILMVTYGHEDYIYDAITSIFNQDYLGYIELVIGNDCSPDKTDDIIKKLIFQAPKHITVIYNNWSSNIGGVANFNKCLELCTSDLICVCDGDDMSLPHRLSTLIDQHLIHQKSLYISNANEMNQGGILTGEKRYNKDFDLSKISMNDLYTAKVPIFGASYAFTRDIIDYYGLIDEDYVTKNNVDQILFWRAHASNGVFYISDPLLQYRVHTNGTSIQRQRNDAVKQGNHFKAMILTLAISNNIIGNLTYILDSILLEKRNQKIDILLSKLKKEITSQTILKNKMLCEDIDGVIYDEKNYKKIISGLVSYDKVGTIDIHSVIEVAYLTLVQRIPTPEEHLKLALYFTEDTICVSELGEFIKAVKKYIKRQPVVHKTEQEIKSFLIEDFRKMDRFMMINDVFFYFLQTLPSEKIIDYLASKIRSKDLTKIQTLIVIADFCGKTFLAYNKSNFFPMLYTKLRHYNKLQRIKKELKAFR